MDIPAGESLGTLFYRVGRGAFETIDLFYVGGLYFKDNMYFVVNYIRRVR